MTQITNTVKHLIIINVIVFFAIKFIAPGLGSILSMHFILSPSFKPWQIVTHMFMHGNEMHLLFNMIGLWMFGSVVEQILGKKRFLILFFVSGIGAVLIFQLIDYISFQITLNSLVDNGINKTEILKYVHQGIAVNNEDVNKLTRIFFKQLVGASGALYGIMVAFGVLMPRAKMGLMFLPIMIEARYFIPLLLIGDMLFGIFGNTGIGHFAHVGGAIAGFIVMIFYKNNQFRRWN
jgi:membrane associated rhomboid family serine protease